jgi:hypothetical protein
MYVCMYRVGERAVSAIKTAQTMKLQPLECPYIQNVRRVVVKKDVVKRDIRVSLNALQRLLQHHSGHRVELTPSSLREHVRSLLQVNQ